MVQKTQKQKELVGAGYGKWFGRWDATHLIHDASQDNSSINEAFLQCECIMTWENCGAYIKHIIHVAPNYKTIISLTKEIMQIDTCWSPSHYLPSEPLLPCNLAHMHCNVRRGVRAKWSTKHTLP